MKRLVLPLWLGVWLSACAGSTSSGSGDNEVEVQGGAGAQASAVQGSSGSEGISASGASVSVPSLGSIGTVSSSGAAPDAAIVDDESGGAGPSAAAGAGGAGAGEADLELGAGDLTLLVVFDKSGSMADGWNDTNKWQVANEALLKAIEPVIDNLTLATVFFPQPGDCSVTPLDGELQVPYTPGPQFLSFWKETQASRHPEGSTPLEAAFRVVDAAVEQAGELGLLEDRFRVVLISDGEPTCNDDNESMVAMAGDWYELGVETWVLGLPGSAGAADLLDAIAKAGGTEAHQSLGEPSELDAALGAAAQ